MKSAIDMLSDYISKPTSLENVVNVLGRLP